MLYCPFTVLCRSDSVLKDTHDAVMAENKRIRCNTMIKGYENIHLVNSFTDDALKGEKLHYTLSPLFLSL